jgi:hypothetical protein
VQAYVVCSVNGCLVEPLIDESDWQVDRHVQQLRERMVDGYFNNVFSDYMGTIMSSKPFKGKATASEEKTDNHAEKLRKASRVLTKDEDDPRAAIGYKWIQFLCFRHQLPGAVRLLAGDLWQQRRDHDRRTNSRRNGVARSIASFVYHAALFHECPLTFRELALSVVTLEDKPLLVDDVKTVTQQELEAMEELQIATETRAMKKAYERNLKDLGISSFSPPHIAQAWINKVVTLCLKQVAPAGAKTSALNNLNEYYKNATSSHSKVIPPVALAASVLYLTLTVQFDLKITLQTIEKYFGIKYTTVSRNNTLVSQFVANLCSTTSNATQKQHSS